MDFQWLGEAVEGQRRDMDEEPRREIRGLITALLPSFSEAWTRGGRGWRQALRDCSCAGQRGPLRRCDSVEHALANAMSHGTLALDVQSLLALWRLSWVRREPPQDNQEPTTGPAAPCLLWARTWRWTVPGWSTLHHQVVAGAGCQERPDLREHCATARAQEAVGAAFAEPPWQSMLEKTVDERFGRECQAFPPGAAALREAERDVPVCKRFQAVVGEGNPGDIRSEVGEDLGAGPSRLAGGHPIFLPDLGRHGIAEASGGQCRFALATEEPGERADGYEPGRRAG